MRAGVRGKKKGKPSNILPWQQRRVYWIGVDIFFVDFFKYFNWKHVFFLPFSISVLCSFDDCESFSIAIPSNGGWLISGTRVTFYSLRFTELNSQRVWNNTEQRSKKKIGRKKIEKTNKRIAHGDGLISNWRMLFVIRIGAIPLTLNFEW